MSDSSQSSRPISPNAPPQRVVSGSLRDRIAKFENLAAGGSVPTPRSYDRAPSYSHGGIVGNRIASQDSKSAAIAGSSGTRRTSERRDFTGNRVPSSGSPSWSPTSAGWPAGSFSGRSGGSRPGSSAGDSSTGIGLGRPSGSSWRSSSPAPSTADSASASSATSAPDSAHSGSAPTSRTSSPATSPGPALPQLLVSSLPDQGDTGSMTPSSTRADMGEDVSDMSMPTTPVAGGVDLPPPGYDLVPGSLMFAASTSGVAPPASVASSLRSEYNPVSEGEESVNLKDVSGVSTPTGTPRQAYRGLDDDASSVGAGSVRSAGPSSVAGSSGPRSETGDLVAASALNLDGDEQEERQVTPGADAPTDQATPSDKVSQEEAARSAQVARETTPISELEPATAKETETSSVPETPKTPVKPDIESSKSSLEARDTTPVATPKEEAPSLPAALAESMSTQMLSLPEESIKEDKTIEPEESTPPVAPVKVAESAKQETIPEPENSSATAALLGSGFVAAAGAGAIALGTSASQTTKPIDATEARAKEDDKQSVAREPNSESKQEDGGTAASTVKLDGGNSTAPRTETTADDPKDKSTSADALGLSTARKSDDTAVDSPKNEAQSASDASTTEPAPLPVAPVVEIAEPPADTSPETVTADSASDVTTLAPTLECAESDAPAAAGSNYIGLGVPRSRGLADLSSADEASVPRNIPHDRDITPHASEYQHEDSLDMDREATPVPDSFMSMDRLSMDGSEDIQQPPPALDDDSDIVSVMGGAMSERDIGSPLASNRSSMPPARASSELEFRFEDLHERFFRDTKPDASPTLTTGDSTLPPTLLATGSGQPSSQGTGEDQASEDVGGKAVPRSASGLSGLPTAAAVAGVAGIGLAAAAAQSDFHEDPISTEVQGVVPSDQGKGITAVEKQFPSVPDNVVDNDSSPSRKPLQVHIEPSPHGVIRDQTPSSEAAPSVSLSAPSPLDASAASISSSTDTVTEKPVPKFPNAPRTNPPSKASALESDPSTPQEAAFPANDGQSDGRLTPMTPGFLLSFPAVPDETHPYVGVHVSPTRSSLSGPSLGHSVGGGGGGVDHPSVPFPREGINSPSPGMPTRRSSSLRATGSGGIPGIEGGRTSITPPTRHALFTQTTPPPPFGSSSPNLSVEGLELDQSPAGPGRPKRHSFTPRSPSLDDEDPGDFEPGEGWAVVSRWESWRGSPPQPARGL